MTVKDRKRTDCDIYSPARHCTHFPFDFGHCIHADAPASRSATFVTLIR